MNFDMNNIILPLDSILQELNPQDIKEKTVKHLEKLPFNTLKNALDIFAGIFEYSTSSILILTNHAFTNRLRTSSDSVLIADLEFYEKMLQKEFSEEAQNLFQKIIPIDLRGVLNTSNNGAALVYNIKTSSIIGYVKLITL
jgi:hypothetical protein